MLFFFLSVLFLVCPPGGFTKIYGVITGVGGFLSGDGGWWGPRAGGPPPGPSTSSPKAVAAPPPRLGSDRVPGVTAYKRVLLKLSGEVFGGGRVGVDPDVVHQIAHEIAGVARQGVGICIVVGGGNFFRGAEMQQRGMDRARADYMGMLGTVMNCLALQDFLEKEGIETRVQTAITMGQVAEPYIPRRAVRHMEKGRVVIFGAGAGMPFFSTDTVAAQRALETRCEVVLMAKQGVDGLYSADPKLDPTATKFETITYQEVLLKGLKAADATAFALCMENKMPIIVFGAEEEGAIARIVAGEKIGTLVSAG
jgi:uridylate kinase